MNNGKCLIPVQLTANGRFSLTDIYTYVYIYNCVYIYMHICRYANLIGAFFKKRVKSVK